MLSIPHLIIIFVVALVVFGPEKLPELARNLGKVMAEFRKATGDLRSTFEGHMKDLEREADQRRIGGTVTPPSLAAPASAPADGTVPTLPAHIAGPGGAVSESTSEIASEPPHDSPNSQPQSEQTSEPKSENDPKSETVSDVGTRPA